MIANETLINAKTGGSFIVGINCTVINPHLETTSLGGRGGDGMGGAGLTERQAGPLDKNPITQVGFSMPGPVIIEFRRKLSFATRGRHDMLQLST